MEASGSSKRPPADATTPDEVHVKRLLAVFLIVFGVFSALDLVAGPSFWTTGSGNAAAGGFADGGVSGTGAAGQVAYWVDAHTITGNNNLFWDNATVELGIGTATPGYRLDVVGGNIHQRFDTVADSFLLYENQGGGRELMTLATTDRTTYLQAIPTTAPVSAFRQGTSSLDALAGDLLIGTLTGTKAITFYTGGDVSGFERVLVTDTSLRPAVDDAYDLGANTFRFQDLFLGPGTARIGTSTTDEGTIAYNTTTNVMELGTDATTNGDIAIFNPLIYADKGGPFVGINDATPSVALDVTGAINATGQILTTLNPAGTTVAEASMLVNPAACGANERLLTTAVASTQTGLSCDCEGDCSVSGTLAVNGSSVLTTSTDNWTGLTYLGTISNVPAANTVVGRFFTGSTASTLHSMRAVPFITGGVNGSAGTATIDVTDTAGTSICAISVTCTAISGATQYQNTACAAALAANTEYQYRVKAQCAGAGAIGYYQTTSTIITP